MNIHHQQKCVEQCTKFLRINSYALFLMSKFRKDSREESHTNSVFENGIMSLFENGIMSLRLESEEKNRLCLCQLRNDMPFGNFGRMDGLQHA